MRLFLLPISKRRSLVYCQHNLGQNAVPSSYGDRVSAKLEITWRDWEKQDKGWRKQVVAWKNKALSRIPYEESGLKSFPPLTTTWRKSLKAGKTEANIDVLFPSQFIDESRVLAELKRLALQRQSLHLRRLYFSVLLMPISAPFALVPIVPNIPFFYVVFRAWAHWRAYRGSKHLELLLAVNAIRPSPSKHLDEIYAASRSLALEKGSQDGDSLDRNQVGPISSTPTPVPVEDNRDMMLLRPESGKLIAECLKLPELENIIWAAVQQVHRMLGKIQVPLAEEELPSVEEQPKRIPLAFLWFVLSVPFAMFAFLVFSLLSFQISEWKEANAPQKRPRYAPMRTRDEIRVLVLKAGKDGESIVCDLRHENMRHFPHFEALSYVWGTGPPRSRIICNGGVTEIGLNLYEALVHLRLPDQDRVLWVDALCINQADIRERTQQVRQMGSIYSAAERVIIWLGKETPANRGAFKMIHAICSQFPVYRWAREVDYLGSTEDLADWEKDFANFQSPEDTVAEPLLPWHENHEPIRTEPIADLLRQPWFRRIWVAQELTSAKSAIVMCGREEIPWNVFTGTIDLMWPTIPHEYAQYSFQLGMPPADTLIARKNLVTMNLMRSKYHSRSTGHTLLDLVLLTRGFECTDPRDKIFALVSIANDVEPTDWEITPDYSRSVEDTFKHFALWSITKRHDLRVLSLTPDPLVPPRLNLPSWVPDLTRVNNAEPLPVIPNLPSVPGEEMQTKRLARWWKRRNVFHADRRWRLSFRTWPRVSLSGDNNELHIRGREVDTIKAVSSVANFAIVPYSNPNMSDNQDGIGPHSAAVKSWLSETLMITTGGVAALPYATFGKWWPTLSCGMDSSGKLLSSKWRYTFSIAATSQGFTIPDYGWLRFISFDDILQLRYHEPAIIRWSQYRRFCSTVDNRLGLVPGTAAPGDIVCILEGARVPYILRPNDDGSYKVIGEAYVYELMHGEALLLPRTSMTNDVFVLH